MTEHDAPQREQGLKGALKTLGGVGVLGFEFAGLIAAGAIGGQWLDKRWDTGPVMVMLGITLGVVLCGVQLWRVLVWLKRRGGG